MAAVAGGSERSQEKGEMGQSESSIEQAGISYKRKKHKTEGGIVPCTFRIIFLKSIIMPSSGVYTGAHRGFPAATYLTQPPQTSYQQRQQHGVAETLHFIILLPAGVLLPLVQSRQDDQRTPPCKRNQLPLPQAGLAAARGRRAANCPAPAPCLG